MTFLHPSARGLLLLLFLGLASCDSEESNTESSPVVGVGTSGFAVAAGTPLVVEGNLAAFLADEIGSGFQQLNVHDTDTVDQVAIVVNTITNVETNIGVAAQALQWVGEELFLVVDEVADNFDWDGDMATGGLVLLHWNAGLTDPVFVDSLDENSALSMVGVGTTLFYASSQITAMATESSLYSVDAAFPTTPRPVFTQDAIGGLSPRILGEDNGLVFLALDETVLGDNRDLNGDGNANDSFVLALLDGEGVVDAGGYTLNIRSTELGVVDADVPLRAVSQGSHDWLVGFLVDEASEETSLNKFDNVILPITWQIGGCGLDDGDMTDQILHAICFADWDMDAINNPPVNTGLAGTSRVLIAGDAVATICPEADEGGCVFNNDADADDSILRWIRIDASIAFGSLAGPVRSLNQLLALDMSLAGPAQSVGELDGVFVIQVDEEADNRDWDGNVGLDRELLGWLDPLDPSPAWVFNHGTSTPSYTATTWMGELPGRTRLGIAYAESSNSAFLNPDTDQNDSVPVFADMTAGPRMAFPGFGVALDPTNSGISLSNGWGFFRVSESQEGADINSNGNSTDILLVRLNLSSGFVASMGVLNTLPRLAVENQPDGLGSSGAYLFDETIHGSDVSGDGDFNDLVVRFFNL